MVIVMKYQSMLILHKNPRDSNKDFNFFKYLSVYIYISKIVYEDM